LCCVDVNFFNGGSSHLGNMSPSSLPPYLIAFPQGPHAIVLNSSIFPLCHFDFCFSFVPLGLSVLNLWIDYLFVAYQKYEFNPPSMWYPILWLWCFFYTCGFRVPSKAVWSFSS
jgi:hypothetical protein